MNPRLRGNIGWTLYVAVFLLLAAAPYVFELPSPERAIKITRAVFTPDGGAAVDVALPHRWSDEHRRAGRGVYDVRFTLQSIPTEPLYLYIPALKMRLRAELDGHLVFDSILRQPWAGPLIQATGLPLLPGGALGTGENSLRLILHGEPIVPGYLSELYIGPRESLVGHFNVRVFLNERLKGMTYSAQFLLGIGIFAAFLYRRREKVFGWLAALLGLSGLFGLNQFANVAPGIMEVYPYVFLLPSTIGCVAVIFSLALIDRPAPRFLIITALALPILSALSVFSGLARLQDLGMYVSIPVLVAGFFIATAVAAWGALREKHNEAALIMGPLALICWYMIHDLAVAAGLLPGIGYFAQDIRPLLLAVITIVLMRRLSISLNKLDKSEEVLQLRLNEREKELDLYFSKEREQAEQAVVENERRRLISDLHDGMGGHLVSIIALSEAETPDAEDINLVARSALDDMRMVIYSLDADGDNLAFALASFRERLQPVLKNLGVELDWSMAALPEIDCAGPSNVLTVLRILQEAVTNAQKHGDPRRITISGSPDGEGLARIDMENHGGEPYVQGGGGYGLGNMRARAQSLGGDIEITPLQDGARLVLRLPLVLNRPESGKG